MSLPSSEKAQRQLCLLPLPTDVCPDVKLERELQPESSPDGHVAEFLAAMKSNVDLAITLNNHMWKVHSNLFKAQSPFFAAICNGQWKESKNHAVELHDDDPRIFARLIQFIYCNDYEGNHVGTRSTDVRRHLTLEKLTACDFGEPELWESDSFIWCGNPIKMHLEVYELADKYGCGTLQELALDNIKTGSNSLEIFQLSNIVRHGKLNHWGDLITRDNKLKETFAQRLATIYKEMATPTRSSDETEGPRPMYRQHSVKTMREWLDWLQGDHAFGLTIMDAMCQSPYPFRSR